MIGGYPYELAGLLYYVFFMVMGSKRNRGVYSFRSRYLTLTAAIVLVACVPLGYFTQPIGVLAMFGVALAALVSSAIDGIAARRRS